MSRNNFFFQVFDLFTDSVYYIYQDCNLFHVPKIVKDIFFSTTVDNNCKKILQAYKSRTRKYLE
jgi:hypothetical protein